MGRKFSQNVTDVARKVEAPLAQTAKGFGLSARTMKRLIAMNAPKETDAKTVVVDPTAY